MFDFLGCPHPLLFSPCWPVTLSLRVAPLGKGRVSFLDRLLAWFTEGLSFPLAILLWMGRLPLSLLFPVSGPAVPWNPGTMTGRL